MPTSEPKTRQEAADAIADAERAKLDEIAGLGNKQRPAAIATVVDTRTGQVFQQTNLGRKFDPDELHPLLQERRQEYLDQHGLDRRRYADGVAIDGDPGNHAEVQALSDALKAREAAGLPADESALGELLLSVRRGKTYKGVGGGEVGDNFPRCADCRSLTDGIDLLNP